MINSEALFLQEQAVLKLMQTLQSKDEIVFKAPTGSGKTVMIAKFMNAWLQKFSDTVFIVTTLAKSELGVQNHKTFLKFQNECQNIKPFIIDPDNSTQDSGIFIPNNFNVYSLTDALFKKTGRITRGPLNKFLNDLASEHKKIIWIKDECHKAFNNFDQLYKSNQFPFIKKINISATPSPTKFPIIDCAISENDAEDACLIKKLVGKIGYGRSQGFGNSFEVDHYDELTNALNKLAEYRTKYMNAFGIRPCMIIQIPDSTKGEEELKHLIPLLNKKTNDGDFFFNWIYICDDVNEYQTNTSLGNEDKLKKNLWKQKWKDEAKKNNSSIDIVIFKMVITEGWDIKRANMLFQIRDTESETLTEQVVGRIRRNPILSDWDSYGESEHKLALEAFVWGNMKDVDREFRVVERHDPNGFISIQTTVLKNLKKIYVEQNINLTKLLENWRMPDDKQSIFDLHAKWAKADEETKNMIWNNITSYLDWFKFSYSLEKITTENKRLFKNYKNTIDLSTKEKLAENSYFEVIKNSNVGPLTIKTDRDLFAWKIVTDSQDEKYYFDSEAELDFAEEMKYFGKKIWARNFYPNSKISFEYINVSKHKSYPDFILIDDRGFTHIFEVKSFNQSRSQIIDTQEYKEKVDALKDFYRELSAKLTKYIFYIPIKYEDTWDVFEYKLGKENKITLDQLKEKLTI